MAKAPKLRPINVARLKEIQEEPRNDRRNQAAVTVLFLTILLSVFGYRDVQKGTVELPAPMTPAFMASTLMVLFVVAADVFAVISLVSRGGDRFRNRSSVISVVLMLIGIALAFGLRRWLTR